MSCLYILDASLVTNIISVIFSIPYVVSFLLLIVSFAVKTSLIRSTYLFLLLYLFVLGDRSKIVSIYVNIPPFQFFFRFQVLHVGLQSMEFIEFLYML